MRRQSRYCAALRIGLRTNGLSTDFAYSPASAIARAQSTAYAAILVDLDLPDGDGIDLIRRLRQLPQIYKTPILVMCADGSWKEDGADAAQLNVSGYLHKPIDIERLTEILDRVVGHDGSGRALILHVDDDQDVLAIVAQTLAEIATIVSVASIEDARCALLVNDFDLTILDIGIGTVSGLELLPHLHTAEGDPIPVIIFTGQAADLRDNPQVKASFDKSSAASLGDLVAAVHDRLKLRSIRKATV